jgi:predicted PolB exonuclease-like 3'-5' exonuclease
MTPVLVFDIETIPDAAGLRAAWGLQGDDASVVQAALERRREQTHGSDFLPLHLHRIAVISMLMRDDDGLRVRSLGVDADASAQPQEEARTVQAFYKVIERYAPNLVSWNGSGFDLQVLNYRAMIHGVQAPKFWDQGEDDRDFRYNNYIGRYHARHTDLMDLLAMYNGRANAPLDQLARLCGFPGKLGMDGSQVWSAWQQGRRSEVRDYCETDVANTWLLWCRFQLLRGAMDRDHYDREVAFSRKALGELSGQHWREFIDAWPE